MLGELGSPKVPLGAVHTPPVAPPPIVPDKLTGSPEQTVCAVPAFAVGGG